MSDKKIKAYKGFEHDMTCRGFQYEVGKTYTHKGDIQICSSGFHACKTPLNVFEYYSPAGYNGTLRRYAEVKQSGTISEDKDKTASSKIILAPFGTWKIAEIIIWILQHIRINIV